MSKSYFSGIWFQFGGFWFQTSLLRGAATYSKQKQCTRSAQCQQKHNAIMTHQKHWPEKSLTFSSQAAAYEKRLSKKKKISKSGWYISYSSNIHIKHYITKIWSLSISQPCLNKASQGISSTSSFSTLGLCKACGAQPIREIYYINPFIFLGGLNPFGRKLATGAA